MVTDDCLLMLSRSRPCVAMPGMKRGRHLLVRNYSANRGLGGLQIRLREPEVFVSGLCHNFYLNVPSSVPPLHVCLHMLTSLGSPSRYSPLRGGPESALSDGDGHQRCQLCVKATGSKFLVCRTERCTGIWLLCGI